MSWHLDTTSKKYICPNPDCRKKTFVAYIDSETKKPVDVYLYGKCDRVNKCNYHKPPEKGHYSGPSKGSAKIIPIYPSEDILKGYHKKLTAFHRFLISKGIPETFLYEEEVLEKNGLTCYIFRNAKGKLCNIKHFKYQDDGHRDKNFESYSLKNPVAQNEYVEEKHIIPLLGEHQLDPEKKKIACIIESEKSKPICKFFYPEYDWVACSSANGLSDGSNDTADKITSLKGRTVYWISDADKAARGEMKIDTATNKEVWVWCSSIRNGLKHIEKFFVVDLWPERTDGWDLGDELLEYAEDIISGKRKKPELIPTFSKIETNPKYKSYIPPRTEAVKSDWMHGVQSGESCHIKELQNILAWMPGFINGLYGWPNDGKGTWYDFMALLDAKYAGRKHLMMKQEDMSSHRNGKGVEIDANRIYTNLVWMFTGITPYKHFAEKHNRELLPLDKYMEVLEWIKKHIYIIHPRDRRYKNVFDEILFFIEVFGIDRWLIDPFKSLIIPEGKRGDERLNDVFIDSKELALQTNTCGTFISHPRSMDEVKERSGERKGAYKIVNQFMQLGGSAWDINMDSQWSIYRCNRHQDPNDSQAWFINLKQRQAEIIGVNKGTYTNIFFDFFRKQYYFGGISPMDGSMQNFQPPPYTPPPKPKKGPKKPGDQLFSYTEPVEKDSDSDVPDWVK